MGLKPPPAPVEMNEWRQLSHLDRVRSLVVRWAEYGADSPPVVHIFYLLKIAAYTVGGLALIGATTPGLGGIGNLGGWWAEPITYERRSSSR